MNAVVGEIREVFRLTESFLEQKRIHYVCLIIIEADCFLLTEGNIKMKKKRNIYK